MDITILYGFLILLTAPITALYLSKVTKDEEDLIEYYFPTLITILTVTSIVFYFMNLEYALISSYMLITLFTWLQITKNKKPKN